MQLYITAKQINDLVLVKSSRKQKNTIRKLLTRKYKLLVNWFI